MGLFSGSNETITTTFSGKDQLSPVVRGIRSEMERFKRGMSDMTRKGGLQNAILGGVGLGAGLSAFGAVSAGMSLVADSIGGVVTGLMGMARAAQQENAEIAQLSRTLDNNVRGWRAQTGAVDAAIESGQKLAFTDSELREAIGTLSLRTHSLSETFRLLKGAQDISRDRNIKLKDATAAVSKAAGGQTRALRSLGFDIDNTAASASVLADVFRDVDGAATTFANTAIGRVAAANNRLLDAAEDLGREVPELQTGFAELGATLGTDVLRGLTDVASQFNLVSGATKSVGRNAFVLSNAWTGVMKDMQDSTTAASQGVIGTISRLGDSMADELRSDRSAIANAANDLRFAITHPMFKAHNKTKALAVLMGKDMGKGLRSQKPWVREQAQQIRDSILNQFGSDGWLTVGAQAARKFVDGLEGVTGSVRIRLLENGAVEVRHSGGGYVDLEPERDRVKRRPGPGRASGGPVEPFREYVVGERGPERLVMGSQPGFVHPNAGNRPVVVENHLYLDGNELKGWMLRTLGREALRSPIG